MSSGHQANGGWTPFRTRSVDESVWQAWVAKGRQRDKRKCARRSAEVRYVVIAVLLLLAAGVGSNVAPYDVMVRSIVAAGALFIAHHAFRSAAYAVGGIFGMIALLYNPIAPVFELTGEWQRVTLLGTAVLFMVSFYWRFRLAHHA